MHPIQINRIKSTWLVEHVEMFGNDTFITGRIRIEIGHALQRTIIVIK